MAQFELKGRGTALNPANRFEKIDLVYEAEWLESGEMPARQTVYYEDTTREILARNDSPDIGFTYSVNPYRGCEHGCVYCYARPTHEYFGWSAGLDFETKILVKRAAPQLLAQAFRRKSWEPQVIVFSGNTDCYQPIERELAITRGCLEVCLQFRNPLGMITKNALILRDLDLLQELARRNLVSVAISITTLNNTLCRKMEPRTSAPHKRLEAIAQLARAGVPVGVNAAPMIPGLNDHELPAILAAAAEHGAKSASYILVRLPHANKELFQDWLATHYAERADKVLGAIREGRSGKLNDPRFGKRFTGEGERAEAIAKLFAVCCQKHGLNQDYVPLATELFRREETQQGDLFQEE